MENYLNEIISLGQIYSIFVNIPGQRVRTEYYAGVEAGNPSGSTSNIKYLHYETLDKSDDKWKRSMLKELTWDASNKILITTVLGN